jgi:glycosyltransferase involved in cell wall biosynthesis
MKILHVTHQFLPRHRAGVEVYTLGLAKEQIRQGHDVAVVTTDDYGRLPVGQARHVELEGLRIVQIGHRRVASEPDDTLGDARVLERFSKIVADLQPDVVHFQHLMYIGLDAAKVVQRARIPSVMTLHEYWLLCARGGQLLMEDGTRCDLPVDAVCANCLLNFRFGRSPLEGRLASLL